MPIPSFRHLDEDSLVLPRDLEEEAGRLLGVVREVYRELGPGLKEDSYQEAMEIALAEAGFSFVAKPRIAITFRGRTLRRKAEPDLLVGENIVVELKAAEEFHPSHFAQLVSYLRASRRRLGSVINFGAPTLSQGIRRRVL